MAGDKLKGNAARLIDVPGYHIHPQYDLVHTRQILNERKNKKKSFHLNLAPMVDMFSILVIYLIMNFVTEGDGFFMSKPLTLPKASKGMVLKSFPLVSVVKDKIVFDAENVGGAGALYVEEPNDQNAPKFRAMLRKIAETEKKITNSDKIRGQVNLQADVNASVEDVKKVMRILIDEGWSGINFIVDPIGK